MNNMQIPPTQTVRLVLHWFSEWNNTERDLFLSTLSCLETANHHHLTINESLSTISEDMDSNEHGVNSMLDNTNHQMTDTFLAHLMNTNLHINSQLVEKLHSSDIFQCQIRLFHLWYPQWSLEQRIQFIDHLKDIQLKSLNESS
ncbi:hypothetical protein EWB00_007331 [Schistosoma japonicum]|uniref:Uncharacterized protein n=1 Tax=Schistosoma japonicum TaxID=6182 RepID=A0A4Z2CV36_SCHJA|nr:hypothetical protein EWB00_007331 [Schistosoma japonicum]